MAKEAKLQALPKILVDQRLPSGRTLVVTGDERLEIHGEHGIELEVALTAHGPVLKLRGARVEIEAGEHLALRGGTVEVAARDDLKLSAGGKAEVAAEGDIDLSAKGELHANAEMIWLN